MSNLVSQRIIEKTKNFIVCQMSDDSYAALYIEDNKYYYNNKDLALVLGRVQKFEKEHKHKVEFVSRGVESPDNNWAKEAFHNMTGGLFK
jgi:hypothetical protein